MPTFEYQAQREDGSFETGVVVGASLDGAATELAAKGFRVTRIGLAQSIGDPLAGQAFAPTPVATRVQEHSRAAEAPRSTNPYDYAAPAEVAKVQNEVLKQRSYVATSVVGPLVGRVPIQDIGFFFTQGAAMLQAGVPIVQSFTTLSRQSRSVKLRGIIAEMARAAEGGHPVSAAMQRYPEVFTPIMLSLVRAGEEGGFMDESFKIVASYIDDEIEIRNIYRRVTFWPKLELIISVIVIIGTNLIIDAIRPGSTKLSSPLTTVSTWMWLGPLLIGIFLFLRVGLANPRIKYNWDMITSKIPYLGKTLRHFAMAKFGRAFAALYQGGVPVTRAIQLSADACGNEFLRAKMYPAHRLLESGAGIAETLRGTNAFSPIVLDMISTGETTGSLDHMLNKAGDFYVDEGKTRMTQLGYVVGAVVALCVGIYIAYIVITFYMQYYGGIMQSVG